MLQIGTKMAHEESPVRVGYPQLAPRTIAALRDFAAKYCCTLQNRSMAIPGFLHRSMHMVAWAWLAVFALASLPRVLFPVTPVHGVLQIGALMLPYALIALAPIAGFAIAAGSFPRGLLTTQPVLRFSFYGRWQRIGILQARENPVFGPAGFMASLLIGMLLNVVVRSFEFLLAMPAIGGSAPVWSERLLMLMTFDVVVLSFFYMVCFVMALRTVPLFPRMLLLAWGTDILMQLFIAREIASEPGLPAEVAAPLHGLLEGNITKVLISAWVWLPYLILSERVNVTYRWRTAAGA